MSFLLCGGLGVTLRHYLQQNISVSFEYKKKGNGLYLPIHLFESFSYIIYYSKNKNTMSELALKLIREAKETRATRLDLGNCGLTELPEAVFELVKMSIIVFL